MTAKKSDEKSHATPRESCRNHLLCCRADTPVELYKSVCLAWNEWAKASMVCLWLYNRFSREFELSWCEWCADAEKTGEFAVTENPSDTSMCAYCVDSGRPISHANASEWQEELTGATYEVSTKEQLAALELKPIICIPLPHAAGDTTDEDGSADELVRQRHEGVVSIHYKLAENVPDNLRLDRPSDQEEAENRSQEMLLTGTLTAMVLSKVRRDHQVRMTREINHLIEQHLTRFQDDPIEVRQDFCEGFIEILKEHLHIEGVSVFWRNAVGEGLTCIGTTGLRQHDNKPLATKREQGLATYDLEADKDSWTVRTFLTGQVEMHRAKDVGEHVGDAKYVDLGPATENPKPTPVLLAPLPWKPPAEPDAVPSASNKRYGVLRCSHLKSVQHSHQWRDFNVVELDVLRFVAEQVSPVLHTLESRIARENAISVVKHDMAAPIVSIRDIVDELDEQFGRAGGDFEYNIRNLQESALALRGMIDRLARDFESRVQVRPRKTRLDKDILPRLKRMMTPFAAETSKMDIWFGGFEDWPALNIDRELVERALYNLIVNAIKYGDRGTTIRIVARTIDEPQRAYAVDVENVGPGINAADAEAIFDMHYRAQRAISTRTGSGLGLSIVRQIMRSHQGDVILARRERPTTFRLIFPASLSADPTRR